MKLAAKTILTVSDLVTSWHVLLADETMDRAVYRIRCQLLRPTYRLEIRLIQIAEDLLYAYQLFTDRPVIRWDNAPHFPILPSFPITCTKKQARSRYRLSLVIRRKTSLRSYRLSACFCCAPPSSAPAQAVVFPPRPSCMG